MRSGAAPFRWVEYRKDWMQVASEVIEESLVTIYVNGEELATFMCTPLDQEALALGLLKNERLIEGMEEVRATSVNQNGCCVDVWLNHEFVKPERLIITSGCGGGVTFDDPQVGIEPLEYEIKISPEELHELFNHLQTPSSLYARTRGVHTAGLGKDGKILAYAEDVGRHSAVDKLVGMCMLEDIDPRGGILLATGRVSSEMLRKGALMGCPLIASRNSPTSLSVEMARAWNITLVGYVRRGGLQVYSRPDRLGAAVPNEHPRLEN